MCSRDHVVSASGRSKTSIDCYREHIVWISTKEQGCGWLGTSSCIVCSISYFRSVANVAGGVEVVIAIVVEHWRRSVLIAAMHVHAHAFMHNLCMVLRDFCCNLTQYHAVSCSTSIISIHLTITCNCSGMRPRTSTRTRTTTQVRGHLHASTRMHVCCVSKALHTGHFAHMLPMPS